MARTSSRTTAKAAQAALAAVASPEVAKINAWFFKTGPGEYAEGDRFIGVRVPAVRQVAKAFRELPLAEGIKLLRSPIHEERLLALLIWVEQAQRGDDKTRQALFAAYRANTSHINNWDLVDTSAPQIVGAWLADRSRAILTRWVRSQSIWERRIAILATFHFIRQGDFADTLRLAEKLLRDEHDLLHKAVGWMLREVGKQDVGALTRFLDAHAPQMPRTMLRYAIERLPEQQRRAYLAVRRI